MGAAGFRLGLAGGPLLVIGLVLLARWFRDAAMESFWSIMQRELLDRRTWPSRVELASAMFE